MMLKKPDFWDYKKPNFLSYMLLPLTLPIIVNNFLINHRRKTDNKNIKKIGIGNSYIGRKEKKPLSIKIKQKLKNLNYKTKKKKKFYKNQADEQKILSNKTRLYCFNQRKVALDKAINDNLEIVIFDDGLQDSSINYDLSFVCFNSTKWIGNGFLIPAGPLREKIQSISKYDVIFLNGNEEDTTDIKMLIKKYNKNIQIFETYYKPINIDKLNNKNKYIVFSGIGNPDSFKQTLTKNKFNVIKEIKFPDHYKYTQKDIDKIKLLAKKLHAKILTTEKDYVKLDHNASDGIQFLEIELVIKEENELINFIKLNI